MTVLYRYTKDVSTIANVRQSHLKQKASAACSVLSSASRSEAVDKLFPAKHYNPMCISLTGIFVLDRMEAKETCGKQKFNDVENFTILSNII